MWKKLEETLHDFSGEQSSMLDIAPNFAGSVMGIINAVGNIMGFVAPLVTQSYKRTNLVNIGGTLMPHEFPHRW